MNRTISEFAALVGLFLLLAAWCTVGWLAPVAVPERAFPAALPAAGILLANMFLLSLACNRILAEDSLFTPVAYLLLATVNPAALWFTPFHGASLLMAVSLFFLLGFCAVKPGMGSLIGAWSALGAAALLFPPLLWLLPVYLVIAVGKAEEKMKFWTASLLAVCLPIGIWLGVCSLTGGQSVGGFFGHFWEQMTDVPRVRLHFPAATLCRLILTAIAVVLALISAVGRLDSYKIARSAAVIRIIILTLAISLLMGLFCPDNRYPAGLVTALPVSLLLNEYFGPANRQKGVWTLGFILLLVLLVERITYFV